MNITEKQILEIKIVLSGRTKTQIFNDLNIDKSYFSKIEKQPNAKNKLNEYFEKLNPEINIVVQKLISMIQNDNKPYSENNNIDNVSDSKSNFDKPELEINRLQGKIIELQDYIIRLIDDFADSERQRLSKKPTTTAKN